MATILFVDDEPGIIDEVKVFFEEEGHRVFTADTGQEGIKLLASCKPDLLVVDIKLPDMSGLRVLEKAKQTSGQLKAIVITGYVDQGLIDEAERLGRDAFLAKPFNLEALSMEVDRLLAA